MMLTHPNAKACNSRPKTCKCAPNILWDGWWEVCAKYKRDKRYNDGRCKTCEHDEACHKMNTTKRNKKRNGGFLDLATALYIAGMTVVPVLLAIAVELLESNIDYPPSTY